MKTRKIKIKHSLKISGLPLPIKPQVASKCLMDIYEKNDHQLTAENVVETARSTKNPLHKCFEWDNKKAGEQYRLHQARKIISCVTVVKHIGNKDVSVKAFVNIRKDNKGNLTHSPFTPKGTTSYYVSVDDAMNNDYLKAYTVEKAMMELNNWMDKYKNLKKLSSLIKVIKKKTKKIAA